MPEEVRRLLHVCTGESPITKRVVPPDTLLQKHFIVEIHDVKIKFILKYFLCCVGNALFNADLQLFCVNFWRPEVFVPRRFVADKFWRCNVFPPKKKNLPLLYETRATFSYELCCRKFCYRRLSCIYYILFCLPTDNVKVTNCPKLLKSIFIVGEEVFPLAHQKLQVSSPFYVNSDWRHCTWTKKRTLYFSTQIGSRGRYNQIQEKTLR